MEEIKKRKQFDFAISYAGEQVEIAKEIDRRLRELNRIVFFAERSRLDLVGKDGESVFFQIFSEAKLVIVLVSEEYKRKDWTRYEWDVIIGRKNVNRFIPIRIDDVGILGLSSNTFFLKFTGKNYDEIIDVAVSKFLRYEQSQGVQRLSEYDKILKSIQDESKGALSQAYQLMKDKRHRAPLDDCQVPLDGVPLYKIIEREWFDFSVVRRLGVKILIPKSFDKTSIRFNLIHCCASHFNAVKPDAIMVLAYFDQGENTDINCCFTAGKVVFAPFGEWGKAQDGVAYNLPTSSFEFTLDFA